MKMIIFGDFSFILCRLIILFAFAGSAGKPGGSIIKSVAKKAQKVLPSTSHTKSHSHDVTGGSGVKSSKTTRDRSGGVVDYSPNTTAAGAGGSRNWQGFKKGSRVNKSMDSLNSVEDEHENVSRGQCTASVIFKRAIFALNQHFYIF